MPGSIATFQMMSPIGPVTISADNDYLLTLKIGQSRVSEDVHPILDEAKAQLSAWFDARLETFNLPLAPLESDEAQAMRTAIAAIPYGATQTYGDVAKRTGTFARAIGQACKTNALPIIVPCHRVVSASGPEYYSAGDGPRTKGWLLDFENANLPRERRTRLL